MPIKVKNCPIARAQRDNPIWVSWRLEDGKKIPIDPNTGGRAKVNEPETWSTYERAASSRRSDGVGIILGQPASVNGRTLVLCGLDLDSCIGPPIREGDDIFPGDLEPWAKEIIERVDSYTETSPSGSGVKIFFYVDEDHGLKTENIVQDGQAKRPHPPSIHFFANGYFTVTGNARRDEYPTTLRHLWPADLQLILSRARALMGRSPESSTRNRDTGDLSELVAMRPLGFTRDQVKQILDALDLDDWCEDYSGWLKVGAALHHEFNGEDEGLDLWSEFSSQSNKFEADVCGSKWKSFGSRPSPLTMATLLKAAKESLDWDEDEFQNDAADSEPDRKAKKRQPAIEVFWGDDDDGVEGLETLVEGFFFQKTVNALYGQYGEGKSFVAIDLGLSIATGRSWFGREVAKGAVLYFAPEGYIGIKGRREAWCKAHNLGRTPKNFALVRGSLNLQKPDGVSLEALATAARERGAKLIILDTLNAIFGGGDENDSAAMSKARHQLELLRDLSGAAVLVVHHAGKEIDRGLRGSSVLGGALDTALLVHSGQIISKAPKGKQKDMEPAENLRFALSTVELSPASDDRARQSCVVVAGATEKFANLNEGEQILLEAAKREQWKADVLDDDGFRERDLRDRFYASEKYSNGKSDTRSKAFRRAFGSLCDQGVLEVARKRVFLIQTN